MSKKVRKSGTNINDIYIGKLALIKEYNEEEKVPSREEIIGFNGNKSITSISIRKIVFTKKNSKYVGTELSCNPLKKNKYEYRVIESDLTNVKNNTLVIENPKKVGTVLTCAGFPTVVRGHSINQIKKLLLSSAQELNIRKHTKKLTAPIFDLQQMKEANVQAANLYWFKYSKLPTKPQDIEKQYRKHFK